MSTEALLERAKGLLMRTMTFYRDDPRTSTWLRDRLERLDQPLRIAVSGRVKSGKSTLINALIGTALAPTDAEERTQVTTFYQYGPEPKILVHTPHGAVQNVPVSTLDSATIRDLQHWRPDEVSRLVIESPTPGLQAITLIETPGVASAAVQETGRSALAQILSESDAVLYLTRYPRQTDLQFLQSVNELQTARSVPINTIVAFSRADETGDGGADALAAAERIADRYRADPTLSAFAQHFIPVVGLLGQASSTMTEDDFKILAYLARLSDTDRDTLLLSAERFVKAGLEAVPSEIRQRLLERFGHYGIARSLDLLRGGAGTAQQLQQQLLETSGLTTLQETLHSQFVERQDALRARSALLAVDMVLRANPRPGVQQLLGEFERVLTNAHEWNELRALSALDSGQIRFARPLQAEAKRLLGASGHSPHARLGLDETAMMTDVADEATATLSRWREQAVNPMLDRAHRDAVRTVLRSAERVILHQIQAQGKPQQAAQAQAQQQARAAQAQAQAQAEQARQAAEAEQARRAAEAEQARRAAEAEQARQAAEAEQARQAAEAERARQAAEAERARQAAEAEQARRAAEAEQARQAAEAERARQEHAAAQARQGEWSPSARSTNAPGKTPATQFLQQNDQPTGRRALREVGTSTGRRRRAEPEQGESRSAVNQPTGSHAKPDPDESSHYVDPTPSGRHSRG
ncbi:isoniazid inducible protein IniC [Saccharopolyspora karakumensis]|uniref:Isoniazid inducible protein IniC n=1 Tax=Saccharopolyspora karakumensis TaxID=2530386 RepID=A0A4V2YXS9_9PSEU|nr:dynamin family protein [Saccharopolyspora karakumensis]TDD90257.1 isoniazid inducible protein IniC [Saccharopolyspora karakumensis]